MALNGISGKFDIDNKIDDKNYHNKNNINNVNNNV